MSEKTVEADLRAVRGTTAWWIAREQINALRAALVAHGGLGIGTWDDLMPDIQMAHVEAAQALLDSGVVLLAGPPTSYRKARWKRLRHRLRWSRFGRLVRRVRGVGGAA